MDVVLGELTVGDLLQDGGDVLDRFLGDLAELTGGDDPSAFLVVGGYDGGDDGQHDSGVLGHSVPGIEGGETVDLTDLGAGDLEELVAHGTLDLTVGDLLFQTACVVHGSQHIVAGDDTRYAGNGEVSRDTDESSELPEPEGELSLPSGTALCLLEDDSHRILVVVGDLAVLPDLLGHEPDDIHPVGVGVGHVAPHVDLVTVSPDPGPECGVHTLHRIEVSRADEDEVAGDGLGLDQGSGGAVGLSGDGGLLLLHSGEEGLLGLGPEGVDLVDVEDTLVRPVDVSCLQPLVGRGLQTAGLVGVVPDVSEKGSGVGSSRIHEGGHVGCVVSHQQLGDVEVVVPAGHGVPGEDEDDHHREEGDEQDVEVAEDEGTEETEYDDGCACVHVGGALLVLAHGGLGLLLLDHHLSLAGGERPHTGLVLVLGVAVGHDVLQLVLGKVLDHGIGQHRLSGTGVADKHHVPLLCGGLLHDLNRTVLSDDAVGHLLRYLDLPGGLEGLVGDPVLHGDIGQNGVVLIIVLHVFPF